MAKYHTHKFYANGIEFTIQTDDLNKAKAVDNEVAQLISADQVFWNDVECYHYQWDKELACGKWLENIRVNNELNKVKALILFN